MKVNTKLSISFYNVMKTISDSIDLMSEEITGHHKMVAYIALRIGKKLDLSEDELRKLVFSGLIHDIGILYFNKNIDEVLKDRTNVEHAYIGYCLLEDYFPLAGYARILKNHHADWNKIEDEKINYLSNIINLSDITAFIINKMNKDKILIKDYIVEEIKKYSEGKINKEILDGFMTLNEQESFWLDATNVKIRENILDDYIRENLDLRLNLEQVLSIGEIVSHVIDFRNPFTATHSKGIATISSKLAEDLSYSKQEVKIMEIAGYFHDIGKMGVPNYVINKKGKLSDEEWAAMKSHTYYSYYVLDNIKEVPQLKEWAAFHHETLDGKGYPFKLDRTKLNNGARILAVSDIFTALTEDRPYRKGYEKDMVVKILRENVEKNKIDETIVELLIDNYEKYNRLRDKRQEEAMADYEAFKNNTSEEIDNIFYNKDEFISPANF
ncbi:MAG: HD domain-containing protein [Halanaerobiales bacterium]|nr:HD domain-containing protein [Halanaerobiales bacterium]